VLSDLYIMLDRVDVHCVLTSQKVLDLLPNPLPEAPPGGVIVTDPGPGVFCDNAMDSIIYPFAPKPDIAQKTRWLKTAMTELNKVGIIGMGDAGMRPGDVRILEGMAEDGEMTLRMNVMLECAERNTFCPDETKKLKLLNAPNGLGEHMLMLGGVKLFADGALGSWGAALLEPYSDKEEISGTMLINETELTAVVKQVSLMIESSRSSAHIISGSMTDFKLMFMLLETRQIVLLLMRSRMSLERIVKVATMHDVSELSMLKSLSVIAPNKYPQIY
jgi:predicted amidohydrolase YtcJ